jgi:hypothetical protein
VSIFVLSGPLGFLFSFSFLVFVIFFSSAAITSCGVFPDLRRAKCSFIISAVTVFFARDNGDSMGDMVPTVPSSAMIRSGISIPDVFDFVIVSC